MDAGIKHHDRGERPVFGDYTREALHHDIHLSPRSLLTLGRLNATTGHITRTVTYTNYVNDQGMILNGTESTDQSAAQNTIHYQAAVTVTGTHSGSLTGDVVINKLTRTITPTTPGSQIQSTLDGDTLVLLDPARVAEAKAST